MHEELKNVGVVIIGRNEALRIASSLDSVLSQSKFVVYVDSGSIDDSCAIARSRNVDIILLDSTIPYSAARARNAGFYFLMNKYPELQAVQFIDGDCELLPGWLEAAWRELQKNNKTVAVFGWTREKFPEASVYNRICSVEWGVNGKVGVEKHFAGIVMIRKDAFLEVGGYNQNVIAAEEDEISIRICQSGGIIVRLDQASVLHDADMHSFIEWWQRTKRAGHAVAQTHFLHGSGAEKAGARELSRIFVWGGLVPLSIALAGVTHTLSLILLFRYPLVILRVFNSTTKRGYSFKDSLAWAVSCSLSVLPQFIGVLQFYIRKILNRPFYIIENTVIKNNISTTATKLEQQNKFVSVAILGAGYISEFHYRALKLLPNVKILAVCDLNQAKAKQFAEANNIPSYYTDLDSMLSNENLDIVHVLTPANLHCQVTKQIMKAGVDVFIEKPLCDNLIDCHDVIKNAKELKKAIGVSHNFLFFPAYEQLHSSLSSGSFGAIDQIEIVWNKSLGQLSGKALNAWMFKSSANVLFEIAPHSFAHLFHLIGEPDSFDARVSEKVKLYDGTEFFKRWEISGKKGKTNINLLFSFNDAYPEHYIKVRTTNAVAIVDFENNTYTCYKHSPYMLDIDRFYNVVSNSLSSISQAISTLVSFVFAKMKLSKKESPFAYSILKATQCFYASRVGGQRDRRISSELATDVVAFSEKVLTKINLPAATKVVNKKTKARIINPKVLVIGGTGFIGKALVKRLIEDGHQVRVLARAPNNSIDLETLGAEVVKGDFTDIDSVQAALGGIEIVYHLARSSGNTWNEYLYGDVEPTRRIAELCVKSKIKRFFYASSIAIYHAGKSQIVIDENTSFDPNICHVLPYPKSKMENEKLLLDLYKKQDLPVVIFRPGIVLGKGGDPLHWGIAAWPFRTVCNLYGDGNYPLPIVLVEDLVEAMSKAIDVPKIDGESFNLIGPQLITANEYLDELEKYSGIKLRRVITPAWKPYLSSVIKWIIKRIGRLTTVPFPCYSDYEGRSFASAFDYTKAKNTFDWQPTSSKEKIICKSVRESCQDWIEK